jgi:hypothetical protein
LKFLAYLPDRNNYTPIASNRDDQLWFSDKASDGLRIRSRVQNPFDRLMVILISPVIQKADNTRYPVKFDLQIFKPSPEDLQSLQKVEILREIPKGVGDYFLGQSHAYISIPLRDKLHLVYKFI